MERAKFSVCGMAVASGGLWGAAVLFVSIGNLIHPPYGGDFLAFVSSLYPWYQSQPNIPSILFGTAYAMADGACGGAIFALIYNACACRKKCEGK